MNHKTVSVGIVSTRIARPITSSTPGDDQARSYWLLPWKQGLLGRPLFRLAPAGTQETKKPCMQKNWLPTNGLNTSLSLEKVLTMFSS